MRTKLVAAIALLALAGCTKKADRETGAMGNDRSGTDTTIESSRIKDTTVVKKDTSINVDTVKKTDHIKKNP
jgi:type IV pilus biogenesis protein CpaD/CtpE